MNLAAVIIIMFVGCLVIMIFYIIGMYNELLDHRNKVEVQFAQIDTEIEEIIELTHKILDVIKVSLKYEEKIIKEIINAKEKIINAKSINDKLRTLLELEKSLDKLFLLINKYSELNTNKKIITLRKELRIIKDKIAYAAPFFNDAVSTYNNSIKQFPTNIIAQVFKLQAINFIILESEKVKVAT